METRMFYTVIKADHKLGGNVYVKGRIHGFMTILCCENPGRDIMHGVGDIGLGMIMPVKTTKERYDKFVEITERFYPELCIFNYDKESE